MRTLLIIALLFMAGLAHGAIYKWVDKDGKVHYSDSPVENAQAVEFKSNTENQIKLPPPVVIDSGVKDNETEPQGDLYQMRITSPSAEETIRDNNGNITIIGSISPDLAKSHVLVLVMDGKVTGPAQYSPIFSLENVDRGEHTFEIKALAHNGKQLASTPPRTIFLHRATVNARPRPTPRGN
ncbi:DUF4124 domain-containing protein [Shewanella colwelliana]|uniref:DUF4124 domain-containing protein n=1 Tax=Shewanella colwelliana TaxID=23 RepID=UPI0022AEF443|nr:DUF4124 domain-containing protein [Shewanella colwelliana]MCZ4337970.1 DUF4124 domain-containing protein [Shewanella colwelliana]